MELKIFLIFVSLAIAVITAAPSTPAAKVEETEKSVEVKTDLTSSIIDADESDSSDATRSKKASEGPKTLCQQFVGADGKTYLQCGQEPEAAASFSINTFSPPPAGHQSSSFNMVPGFANANAYGNSANDMKPSMSHTSSSQSSHQANSFAPSYSYQQQFAAPIRQPQFAPGASYSSSASSSSFAAPGAQSSYQMAPPSASYSYAPAVPGLTYTSAQQAPNALKSAAQARAEAEAAAELARIAMEDAKRAADGARAAYEFERSNEAATSYYAPASYQSNYQQQQQQMMKPATSYNYQPAMDHSAQAQAQAQGDWFANYRVPATASVTTTTITKTIKNEDAQAKAREAYEQSMQAQAMNAYDRSHFSAERSDDIYAPGLPPPPPPPQPKAPCASPLLFSCAPSVVPVPCEGVHHPAPAMRPPMAYYPPANMPLAPPQPRPYARNFPPMALPPPQPSYNPAPTNAPINRGNENGAQAKQSGPVIQPSWTVDDKEKDKDQAKADWS